MTGMVPEDVYRLSGAGDPRVSPSGDRVAYVIWGIDAEANDYVSSIWIAPVGDGEPTRFTHSGKRDASPRWSPGGERLAFTSNRDSKKMQLYVIPAAGGEAEKLTDFDEDVGEVEWSPDGTRIAFSVRVRDEGYKEGDDRRRAPRRITRLFFKLDNEGWICDRHRHVFVVAADGSSSPVQLTKGDFEHSGPTWSPDGARIAFSAARHDDWDIVPASDIYVSSADNGEPRLLTSTDGGCMEPAWSQDGDRIAYYYYPGIFDDPRHVQIAVIGAAGGEGKVLTTSLDRGCQPYPSPRGPAWEGDGLLFGVEDHGNTHLYRVAADGSAEPQLVVGDDTWVTGFDTAAGVLAYTASTPTTFSELFVDGECVTGVGENFFAEHEPVVPERFVATSKDGSEVEAWIMRPAGFVQGERYPVLVNIHGGPFTQYGNKFFDEFQVYAGAGYVVVYSNPRGSSGYSEEWGRAIRGPVDGGPGWGSVDYEDIMAVTQHALDHYDYCDRERVGVMGGSYGGYMTSWIVSHTDFFKAACSERAVNNWVSMYGSSDMGWDFKGYMGPFLHEDMDPWIRFSPTTYATNINTPLLIMHSEDDLRCNVEQAEQLFTTLRLLKRDVEFVRFPAEGHELTRSGNPVHRVMRFEIVLEFFGRHLKN